MAKQPLTVGKRRALGRAATPEGHFAVLALDHQDALRAALAPEAPLALPDEALVRFKRDALAALGPEASGALLDPVYGAAQAVGEGLLDTSGLLVELEKADYGMNPLPLAVEVRPGWSVAQIKRMHADGVKLFFYYHPEHAEHAAAQEAVLSRTVVECGAHDLPLFAEPIAFPFPDSPNGAERLARDRERVVVESARRVAQLGADVLKLEFPLDVRRHPDAGRWARACQRLSEAVDVPWVLLSAGVDFDTFCRQVEVACAAGAAGFLAGRALWGDACALDTPEARRRWLEGEGRARMRTLADIVRREAAPWHARFAPPEVSTTWFQTY